jgi:hypothetical protein
MGEHLPQSFRRASSELTRHKKQYTPMGQLVRSWSVSAAWLTMALLMLLALPLFLCMPVWIDASLYDLAARNVLHGGVHYRDLFDTNLPGMLWLHLVVRSALGWSTEALRLVDILLFGLSGWLLGRWLKPLNLPAALPAWLAVFCFLFYFSTTEWCHCQRDMWMLPFTLVALHLHRRQMADLVDMAVSGRQLTLRGLAEGLCWGAAFWIKPFVIVPAIACWLLCAIRSGRATVVTRKRVALDAGALLVGGLVAGVPGVAWLMATGSWPGFWDVMLNWNREYVEAANPLRLRFGFLITRLFPWGLLHLVALPLAVWTVLSALHGTLRRSARDLVSGANIKGLPGGWWEPHALLAGFYLGWTFQAVILQKSYDYSLAPLPPMALALIVSILCTRVSTSLRWGVLVSFGCVAVILSPVWRPERVAQWGRCWREGSTAELRDRLKLLPEERYSVDWEQLERVRLFLLEQGVGDGELTCYHTTTHPLYLQLDLRPTTPYLHFDMILNNFPMHREQIRRQLDESGQRYVVSDLAAYALRLQPDSTLSERPGSPNALPPQFPQQWLNVFPWNEPILFRAGRYLVHRVTKPVEKLMPESSSGNSIRAVRR